MNASADSHREKQHRSNQRTIEEFRATSGKPRGPVDGLDLLLLYSVGATTGVAHVDPVSYLAINGTRYLLGWVSERDAHPAWVTNIRAHPGVRIELSGADIAYGHAEELHGQNRNRVLTVIKQRAPTFAENALATTRIIPVFALRTIRLSI